MTSTILSVTPEYGYVILAASAIILQNSLVGASVGAARRKYNLKFPDMGNGRYSQKLTDAQWVDFNNHQRIHYNYIESVANTLTLQLLSGLFYPRLSAAAGAVYVIGRWLYGRGYVSQGPDGRLYGAIVFHLSEVAWLGSTVYGALRLTGLLA